MIMNEREKPTSNVVPFPLPPLVLPVSEHVVAQTREIELTWMAPPPSQSGALIGTMVVGSLITPARPPP